MKHVDFGSNIVDISGQTYWLVLKMRTEKQPWTTHSDFKQTIFFAL